MISHVDVSTKKYQNQGWTKSHLIRIITSCHLIRNILFSLDYLRMEHVISKYIVETILNVSDIFTLVFQHVHITNHHGAILSLRDVKNHPKVDAIMKKEALQSSERSQQRPFRINTRCRVLKSRNPWNQNNMDDHRLHYNILHRRRQLFRLSCFDEELNLFMLLF